MYDELYEFLIHYKQLPLPGIGTIVVDRKSANLDFPGKQILPPSHSIHLLSQIHHSSRKFHNWLSNALRLSDRDALIQFNDFVFDLKKQIIEGKKIHWKGVGTLAKGPGSDIQLLPDQAEIILEQPVHAERVLRTNAIHMVRVGEEEKTSTEMFSILHSLTRNRSKAWIAALVLLALTIVFIILHFANHGSVVASSANKQKIAPMESSAAPATRP